MITSKIPPQTDKKQKKTKNTKNKHLNVHYGITYSLSFVQMQGWAKIKKILKIYKNHKT